MEIELNFLQTTLFEKGGDKINSEFKSILDKYNTPMLPVVLLDLINVDGGFLGVF